MTKHVDLEQRHKWCRGADVLGATTQIFSDRVILQSDPSLWLSNLLQTTQSPKVSSESVWWSSSTHIPCCTSESLSTRYAGKSSGHWIKSSYSRRAPFNTFRSDYFHFFTPAAWKSKQCVISRAFFPPSTLSDRVSCLLGSTAQDENASANSWILKSVSHLLLECNCLHICVESILRGSLPLSLCRAGVCRDQSYLGSDIQRYDAGWPPWSLPNF